MRSRQEIKALAKERFKANYWNCVLADLLVSAVLGVIGWLANGQDVKEIFNGRYGMRVTFSAGGGFGGILSLLLMGPLTIGLTYFFIRNVLGATEGLTVTTPFTEAFKNYPRKLGGSLWAALFTILWSLLFIIPGIIKAFSYSMTNYILADCPEVKAKDALKLSMRMMNGHKGQYFMLYLSFIGWGILTLLTFGLVGIFYAGPYMSNACAAFYLEVQAEALRTGAVTRDELEGFIPA